MRFLKEPIFYFLIIGGLIFLADHHWQKGKVDRDVIVITKEDITRIKTLYAQNWNEEPEGSVLKNLIDQYVTAEIYYREALKLNLDHNDEIIKRRLKQKYEFLAQDLANLQEPPEDSLKLYYQANLSEYQLSTKYSFFHFFINPDKYADPEIQARKVLIEVNKFMPDDDSDIGDPSHISSKQLNIDKSGLRRIFGLDFADQFEKVEDLGWQPVMQSGLGYHLVYITQLDAAKVAPFQTIRDQVLLDWQADNRQHFKNVLIRDLKKNYEVIVYDEE